ncbi:3-methyladenine DNA glycosylase AlkC [Actinoplanes lutulentus]|uniref:3-methyladenine DNA glycosylase AlkC n=1 Tax=Actinoplanes lutulentus TaxID=1287878 RepID=A0A327ZBU0_9ACTN|nr:DNA alkylation repair protein [Actinoplanes lutulentus]MBB2947149.1 3-methyladenine DNA glycosylase AlkC [Actinoplanes lutulentus]RAK36425.1 3-methyladenine DNA glycosylase AlkC [Actinoplanes lutulentus]
MPFADQLINARAAEGLIGAVRSVVPSAGLTHLAEAGRGLDGLALRERADLLRDALLADLPGDYARFAEIVRGSAPLLTGWMVWPVTSAVAAKAVADGGEDAFDDAMALLAELTGRLTAEFAIRTLLRHDLDRALQIVQGWTASDDLDVRRLASEGTRPYLPWSIRVPEVISRAGVTVPILDALYRDDSEYVRRSVGNHLNDLSRDQPELVVETAGRWLAAADAHTASVVRRGLRTLVKKGHPGALATLGFAPATIDVEGPVLEEATVAVGGVLGFSVVLRNTGTEAARIAVDYVIYHRKADGSQSGKTFKLTTRTLEPGEELRVVREHSFRPITTRRYYAGPHGVALQVNGVVSARAEFELTAG